MEYEFSLRFRLVDEALGSDELVDRLAAAGCDDALVGTGQAGRIALDFKREAASAHEAIVSALRDVKTAIPAARLLEVSPDLVGLTDVAALVGVTRQNMRKLSINYADSFPSPVHAGTTALWHLFQVLVWLREQAGYAIDRSLVEVAHVAMQVNLAREASLIEHRVRREVRQLVA